MEQISERSTMVELSLGKEHITNNEFDLKLGRDGISEIDKWTSKVFIFVNF